RRQISKPEGIVLGDSAAAEARIEAGRQCWRQRIALNAWAQSLDDAERDKLWRSLQSCSARQRDLDELMYCVGADEKNVAALSSLLQSAEGFEERIAKLRKHRLEEFVEFLQAAAAFLRLIRDDAQAPWASDEPAPILAAFAEQTAQVLSQVDRCLKLVDTA